jgi:hypothetical protein
MAFSVVVPIIVSAAAGVGGIVTYILGLLRGGQSTQQLRWAFVLMAMFAVSIGYGAIALRQPISNPTGLKETHWGHRTLEALGAPLVVASVVLGIFPSFGARVMIPLVSALMFVALAVGPFVVGGFSMWFWFMVACFFYIFTVTAIFLVDRLDVVEENIKGQRTPMPAFNGLLWRILTSVMLAVYLVFWALSPDTGKVMTVTTMYILYGIMDFAFLGLYAFLNYILVKPVEPIYTQTLVEAGKEGRTGISAPLTGSPASKQRALDLYSA